jgi:uncharacterized protein YlxP (DUF503 family)
MTEFDSIATQSADPEPNLSTNREARIRQARTTPFQMVIALLSVELFIPYSQSLKDKRMVLRRIKDRLQKFNVAVAEVAHQDLWQRAGLGIVVISTAADHAERELAKVADEIERVEPGLVTRTEIEFLT